MRIHKQGIIPISVTFLLLISINTIFYFLISKNYIANIILHLVSIFPLFMVIQFFRNPQRKSLSEDMFVVAPADGKIVAIEEIDENEFFNEKRIQVSIFMSIYNVHVNRFPVSGEIVKIVYKKGKFLIASNPKSSVDNEMNIVIIENKKRQKILVKQIAGIVARRIICSTKQGETARQGEEFGFIKFGSRVDLILPINTKIKVKLEQKVMGGLSIIAEIN